MRPVMIVVGTRPEGIKMIPVYCALKAANIPTLLCATSQHQDLLADVFSVFNVIPDIDLKIMKDGQDLFYITTIVLQKLKEVFVQYKPSLLLVQGDTTTVMAAGLAAFYTHIPIGHVEAGLRTGDMYSPYPEEFNRLSLGLVATYHFAPTAQSAAHLLAEGKKREHVFCVGNTVVDALRMIEYKIKNNTVVIDTEIQHFFASAHAAGNKTLLFTMHRRESFGVGLITILQALKVFALAHSDVSIIYPYHPNPNVMSALEIVDLYSVENITLIPAVSYKDLAYILLSIDVVATDSGGIQEEAVSLGKHVIVLREKSERMEGVWEDLAVLVGFNAEKFRCYLEKALDEVHDLRVRKNIYGDGFAAEKIVKIIQMNHGESFETALHLQHCFNDIIEERK
jgi:UDP-N-acetylglucosamine 2-epimerase (non-hydrolysing)